MVQNNVYLFMLLLLRLIFRLEANYRGQIGMEHGGMFFVEIILLVGSMALEALELGVLCIRKEKKDPQGQKNMEVNKLSLPNQIKVSLCL